MKKIKVLHINPTLDVGGMETMIVQLCNHIDKNRFIIKFCSLTNNMPKAKEFDNTVNSMSLGYNLNLRGLNLILNFWGAIHKLGKLLRKEQPDVIHIHGLFTIYLLVAIAVRLYCPATRVVKTIHTSGLFYTSDRFIDQFRLWIEKIATRINRTVIVGISEQVIAIAQEKFSGAAKTITKIYNGIDLSLYGREPNILLREKLRENKNILVAYVARIVDGKNHDFLIDIWYELKKKGDNRLRLIFIGDGENLEKIRKKIDELNLKQEIICLGQCSNVSELLACADFAVFPSDYEGFSIAMIEKLASSLPVIASDIPPFREIITSGKNGIILSLDDKEGWIKAIEMLSENNSFRNSMSIAAKERSKEFSVELMAKEYEFIYTNENFY